MLVFSHVLVFLLVRLMVVLARTYRMGSRVSLTDPEGLTRRLDAPSIKYWYVAITRTTRIEEGQIWHQVPQLQSW